MQKGEHYYERIIVDVKHEYTTFLTNILVPLIYEGLKSIYAEAEQAHNTLVEMSKVQPNVEILGVLKIFQTFLAKVPQYSQATIQNEVTRIKIGSKCAEWFDDLVHAVMKSYMLVLTFKANNKSQLVDSKAYNNISVEHFIHQCYIEVARSIYNNAELFWPDLPAIELRRNQRMILEIIEKSIHEAIRKILPMRAILQEFLKNNYVEEQINANEIRNRIMLDADQPSENNRFEEISENDPIALGDIQRKIDDITRMIKDDNLPAPLNVPPPPTAPAVVRQAVLENIPEPGMADVGQQQPQPDHNHGQDQHNIIQPQTAPNDNHIRLDQLNTHNQTLDQVGGGHNTSEMTRRTKLFAQFMK